MSGNWRDRAGCSLLDQNDPHGNPIATPLDRRWLWRIANDLAVSAGSHILKDLGRDLHQYLNETCEHHWMYYAASEDPEGIGAHRQCLWCNDAIFGDDPGSHYVTFLANAWFTACPQTCPMVQGRRRTCPYHIAVKRIIGHGAPVAGRWRIASIDGDGGLPELERADDRPEASAA